MSDYSSNFNDIRYTNTIVYQRFIFKPYLLIGCYYSKEFSPSRQISDRRKVPPVTEVRTGDGVRWNRRLRPISHGRVSYATFRTRTFWYTLVKFMRTTPMVVRFPRVYGEYELNQCKLKTRAYDTSM